MAEIGKLEIKRHGRSRNRKVLLCKEEWKEKAKADEKKYWLING
jgi:hypothetical protein